MVTKESATTTEFRVPLPYINKMGENGHAIEPNGLEFDGTAVLCRVCGDKASGFHYGVHSCEGCKGFFRRSIQQKIQYRPCTKNQQCSVLRVNRNRCQYCRLKKCHMVGMSREAVRFGRVPKREKARIMAAMEASHLNKANKQNIDEELTSLNELKSIIINAHLKTCEFTKSTIERLIKSEVEIENVKLEDIATPMFSFLTCPLYPTDQQSEDNPDENFADRFTSAVRGVVEFAKQLPGFTTLAEDDQVILLKTGVFELLLLRLSNMFISDRLICMNGKIFNIINIEEEIDGSSTTSHAKLLIRSMLKFLESFNEWDLNDDILGVFSSMVLMSWDRPGLSNPELIKDIQSRYRLVLQTLLPIELCSTLESKITDLRMLSAMHSEKLLSFGLEDKSNCRKRKRSVNRFTEAEDDVDCNMEMDTGDEVMNRHNQLHLDSFPYSTTPTSGFPVSPSNDSGVESGACSSPSRSEISETMSNVDESYLYIRRTIQAPPALDSAQNYQDGDKSSESDCEFLAVGHKKFRRKTLSPPPDAVSPTRRSVIASPPYFNDPYEHFIQHSDATTEGPVYKSKTPLQLYPQLASALTRPSQPSPPIHYINVEELNMTALKQSLLNPPVAFNSGTSDYLHRIIMRNELTDENKIPAESIEDEAPLNLCMKKSKRVNGLAT